MRISNSQNIGTPCRQIKGETYTLVSRLKSRLAKENSYDQRTGLIIGIGIVPSAKRVPCHTYPHRDVNGESDSGTVGQVRRF
jgi:hypothetical protein